MGAIWEEQTVRLALAGNLARVEARGVFVHVQIGNLEPVRLAFAWAQSSQVPLILGQTNFFREFDVCFQRSRLSASNKRRCRCHNFAMIAFFVLSAVTGLLGGFMAEYRHMDNLEFSCPLLQSGNCILWLLQR